MSQYSKHGPPSETGTFRRTDGAASRIRLDRAGLLSTRCRAQLVDGDIDAARMTSELFCAALRELHADELSETQALELRALRKDYALYRAELRPNTWRSGTHDSV